MCIRDRSVSEDETAESFPGEMAAYLKAVVDDKLYRDVSPAGFAKSVKTAGDAIRYGMAFERDAILFFNELSAVMAPHERSAIQKLVDEEKQHLVYLADLGRKIT